MNSESLLLNPFKTNKQDYTNVSTQNSSQHSIQSCDNMKRNQIKQQRICEQQSLSFDQKQTDLQDYVINKQSRCEFYKRCITWLAKKYKKLRVKIQTLYLSISYLIKYMQLNNNLIYKPQTISAVCILLASKMNQIQVPSIKSILSCIQQPIYTNTNDSNNNNINNTIKSITKNQIIRIEQEMLQLFAFDIAMQKNCYSIVNQYLKSQSEDKKKNAEKLLFLSLTNLQCLEYGEEYVAWGVVYLVRPDLLKDNNTIIDKEKVKKVAYIVYKIYKEKKQYIKQNNSKTSL